MATRIQEAFDIQAQVIAGSGGVFDVHVNDELVYSKAVTGTFPNEDDLVAHLRQKFT